MVDDHEDYQQGFAPAAHKLSHQDGGTDEISIAGLVGVSAALATHAGLPTVHQDAPALIETHRLVAAAHHAKFTAAEARAAINNIFGSDGKADADIDLDAHDLKGGSVILPNGKYIGIGAALERLEFYTAGYAAFMGCYVGIGTTIPRRNIHVHSLTAGSYFNLTNSTTGSALNSGFDFVQYDNNASLINREDGFLAFRTNNIERFRIQNWGGCGIGVVGPTAILHLKAAAAAANQASLKINPGVVATVPVSGNIESDGVNLYWTDSGGTRRQLNN